MGMSPRLKARRGRFGASGLAPTVRILTPPNGTSVAFAGSPAVSQTFTGEALDDLTGDVSSTIVWTSSIDGALGVGASVSPTTLSVGLHTITATVTVGTGVAHASIQITVTA